MAVKLIVNTEAGTKTLTRGTVKLDAQGASVYGPVIRLDNTATEYSKAIQDILAQGYVTNINSAYPTADGELTIVGDACTTVAYKQQLTPQQQVAIDPTVTNQLYIFDQCPACGDCDYQWQLLQRVQDAQIIVSAMKDNNLYYDDAAEKLWSQMLAKRVTEPIEGTCTPARVMTTRSQIVRPAIRLLSQYRSLVHLWNYIVIQSKSTTYIQPYGDGDFDLNITTQYAITQCSKSAHSYTVHLQLSLLNDSVRYSQLSDSTVTMPSTGYKLLPYVCIKLFVSDSLSGNKKLIYNSQQSSADLVITNTPQDPVDKAGNVVGQGKLDIECTFASASIDFCKPCTLYAQITVLPTIAPVQQNIETRQDYNDLRKRCRYPVAAVTQSFKNCWQLKVVWACDGTILQQDTYVQTAGLVPLPLLPKITEYITVPGLQLNKSGTQATIYAKLDASTLDISIVSEYEQGYYQATATIVPGRSSMLMLPSGTLLGTLQTTKAYYIKRT